MSATRDKSQKIAFVYSNLYQVYRKGKEAAIQSDPAAILAPVAAPAKEVSELAAAPSSEKSYAPILGQHVTSEQALLARAQDPARLARSTVIKAENARETQAQAQAYEPIQLLSKRIAKPAVLKEAQASRAVNPALEGLKQNLQTLNDLHSRLRFMLQELEDLVKE